MNDNPTPEERFMRAAQDVLQQQLLTEGVIGGEYWNVGLFNIIHFDVKSAGYYQMELVSSARELSGFRWKLRYDFETKSLIIWTYKSVNDFMMLDFDQKMQKVGETSKNVCTEWCRHS